MNIGLDLKPPKIEGDTKEDKCPWCGTLKVRGRVFQGEVVSSKAKDTAIVKWDYYVYVYKYERYERRKTRISVHNPKCMAAKKGDKVTIAECRPLSKTKKFVIVEKV